MGSILSQLLQERDVIPDTLQQIYEMNGGTTVAAPSSAICEQIISLLRTYDNAYLVLDALDECNDETRWGLLEHLRSLGPNVHILITSRFHSTIDEELVDFSRLEISAHNSDIELFIDDQIQRNKNLRKMVEKQPALRLDIKQGVLKTAQGM